MRSKEETEKIVMDLYHKIPEYEQQVKEFLDKRSRGEDAKRLHDKVCEAEQTVLKKNLGIEP